MSMALIDCIKQGWGWTGIAPVKVVSENDFGNLIVRDEGGKYWRICPEELSCEVIASDRKALDVLIRNEEFLQDWAMSALVVQAREEIGPLAAGRKYCLKTPGVLGGKYERDNLASIALAELVEVAGSIASQIKDLPDGTQVEFVIVP